jgi:LemA protein
MNTARSRRGAASALVILLVVVLGLIGFGACTYNSMVGPDEKVSAAWSEIQSQYKRRYDLIPQLVETVKGAASFEQETIIAVTEARASVGRMQLPDTPPTDPAELEAYLKAQQTLGGALSRLLVAVENYPELKASQNFLSLQDQIEGTENRIAVSRRDYIDAVQTFNARVRRFPANVVAGMFGFEPKPQLPAEEGVTERPQVEFDFDTKK